MTREDRKRAAMRALGETPDTAQAPGSSGFDPASSVTLGLLGKVLGTLPVAVYRCRLDGARTMEFMSLGCRTLTGFDAADLVENRAASFAQLIHAEDLPRVQESLRGAVQTGEPFDVAYRIRRVDGRERQVREHGYPVLGPSGEAVAIEGLLLAVSGSSELDLKRAASRIAHDLSNALATVKTTAELALLEARHATLVGDLSEIMSAADRAAALCDRLRRIDRAPPAPPDAAGEAVR